jgi:hypothetical protein
MGAKGRNFYNERIRRQGYEDTATKIQGLHLDGLRMTAELVL